MRKLTACRFYLGRCLRVSPATNRTLPAIFLFVPLLDHFCTSIIIDWVIYLFKIKCVSSKKQCVSTYFVDFLKWSVMTCNRRRLLSAVAKERKGGKHKHFKSLAPLRPAGAYHAPPRCCYPCSRPRHSLLPLILPLIFQGEVREILLRVINYGTQVFFLVF